MADIKTLQTRIALKYDTYENWTGESKGANVVLLKGEIGLCAIGDTAAAGSAQATTNPTVLFKVGDGTTPFKSLKWASALAADVHNWAKAETVTLEDKKLKFKNHDGSLAGSVDLSTFATDAYAKDLAARLAEVESKLGISGGTGESSVANQIEGLDTRLDIIEGEGEGSVKKALADAKAYVTEREAEIKAAYEKYTDEEVAKNKQLIDGLTAADAELTSAINDETEARTNADAALEAKLGSGFSETDTVAKAITTAIATAAETAQDKVDALANGAVKTNTENISKANAAITEVAEDLAEEIERATGVEADFETRIATMETFWETTEDKDDVVNKLKEIQDYIASDETGAATMAGNIQTNAQAITTLQGRVSDVEAKATANETAIGTIEEVVDGYTTKGSIKTAVEAAATKGQQGIDDAKAAQDTADAVKAKVEHETTGLAKTYEIAFGAASDTADLKPRMGTAEGNITALQNIVLNGSNTNAALRTDITELQGIVKTGDNSNEKLRADIKSVSDKVNDASTGLAKTKEIADNAASAVADVKADYLKQADLFIIDCGTSTTVLHTVPTTN